MYGQDRPPQIYYFVGDSSHPKVHQMWVLEKLVDKDRAAQDKVAEELGNANAVHSGALDITDYAAVKAAFAGVAERHGRIDALVNIAGGIRSQCERM